MDTYKYTLQDGDFYVKCSLYGNIIFKAIQCCSEELQVSLDSVQLIRVFEQVIALPNISGEKITEIIKKEIAK